MDNYHPISLVTAISKLFEKVVFSQLYEYFHKNNLFYDSQYGCFKNHSTEYAAMELTDKVLKDIDEKNISLTIFMDLSKAFDTLDHNILIKKLAHYGINGTLEWFTSYLTGCSQYVEIDGVSFNVFFLIYWCPTGFHPWAITIFYIHEWHSILHQIFQFHPICRWHHIE